MWGPPKWRSMIRSMAFYDLAQKGVEGSGDDSKALLVVRNFWNFVEKVHLFFFTGFPWHCKQHPVFVLLTKLNIIENTVGWP